MGSDRARRTYDEERQYRRVIAQQGRAIVEADLNEAQEISTEEQRREALDIVGPVGTPDKGYALSFPASSHPREIGVGRGTMYVGGMRVSLAEDITYWRQPDWLDGPSAISSLPTYELVCLHLTEQEVSAEEDRALREVALGGPDTAQRSRLVQRILRFPLTGASAPSCKAAMDQAASSPVLQGLSFDKDTMALSPVCRLQAAYPQASPQQNPCSPVAQTGYLGAENQLIRLQISESGKLLWARDNASSIHRVADVTVTASSATTSITLASSPVDAQHQPRKDQYVELLRRRAHLGDEDYVAAPTGLVVKIASYDAEKKIITLDSVIDPQYVLDGHGKKLFARIWEDEISFTAGTAVDIGDTGLEVTLTGAPFAVGSYWMVALRPGAPAEVFPSRYLDAGGQPPEGSRQWLCPLGVVQWLAGNNQGIVKYDCRKVFDNLVELTARPYGWLTISIGPVHVSGGLKLQDLLDDLASKLKPGDKVTVGLQPGIYELPAPLQLGPQHSGIFLEGNGGAAVFQKLEGATAPFLDGLVCLNGAVDCGLHGLKLIMPSAGFEAAGGKLAGESPTDLFHSSNGDIDFRSLRTAVGVRIRGGSASVRDCTFDYSDVPSPSLDITQVFAAGLLLHGDVQALDVQRNTFSYAHAFGTNGAWALGGELHVFGVVHASNTYLAQVTSGTAPAQGAVVLNASLGDAVFRDNHFEGLTAAVLLHTSASSLRIESNEVERSYSGFWIMPRRVLQNSDAQLENALEGLHTLVDASATGAVSSSVTAGLIGQRREPLITVGGAIARAYPLPAGTTGLPSPSTLQTSPPRTSLQDLLIALEAQLVSILISVDVLTDAVAVSAPPSVITITGNRLDCPPSGVGGAPAGAGAALSLWDASWYGGSGVSTSVILSANWIQGSSTFALTTLVGARWCAVSGNTIRNRAPSGTVFSLAFVPPRSGGAPETAFTGNTFKAGTALPKRITPVGQPAVPWSFFNRDEDGSADTSSLGVATPIYFAADLASPLISQRQRAGTGNNAGTLIRIKGQQGQNQSSAVPDNHGGDVQIEGGAVGTGGYPTAAKEGAVRLMSNDYSLAVSSGGVGVELGGAAKTFSTGSETIYLSEAMRWTSKGSELLRVAGAFASSTAAQGVGAILAPAGLVVVLDDTAISYQITTTEGHRLTGARVTLDEAPLVHRKVDVPVTGGAAQLNLAKGCLHEVRLNANTTITAANVTNDMRVEVRVWQQNQGNYTLTWSSAFKFYPEGDAVPSAQGLTIYDFSADSGGVLRCVNVKKGLS